MKKLIVCALCLCLLFGSAFTASAARDNIYLRLEVGYEGQADYSFAKLGQELTIYATLENGAEGDDAFQPEIKYTKESTEYEEAKGFKWLDIESDGSATVKWTPTEDGLYCFSAETKVPSTKKTISSLDSGMPVILVVDMEKKTVVKTAEELVAALSADTHYISVEGDIALSGLGLLQVDQQIVFEVAADATLTVSGTELRFGTGKWNLGATVVIDGTLIVKEDGTVTSGEYPVDMFVSGDVEGWKPNGVTKIEYIGCNVSPFEVFEGDCIRDKATGITTVIEGMNNATVLDVTLLEAGKEPYTYLSEMDKGEVIIAFESSISNYEGQYTLSVPVDAKYNGLEVTVYIIDTSVEGFVRPTTQKAMCNGGIVAVTVDKDDVVMLKAPVPKYDQKTMIMIGVAGGALLLMILLGVVPMIVRSIRRRTKKKLAEAEEAEKEN